MHGNSSNISANWSNNETLESSKDILFSYGTIAHIVNVAISVLAMVVGGVALRCLHTHRKKFSEMIFQQSVSFYVTNLIAGLTPMISTLTLIESINRSRQWCISIANLTNIAHFAVLLNLNALSIRRWLVLRQISVPSASSGPPSRSVNIFYTTLPWIISFICISPDIWLSFKLESSVNGCLSERVRDEMTSTFSMFLFYVANAGALLLLVVVSILSILILCRLKQIHGNASQNRRQQQNERALKLLIVALGMALLTSLPSILFAFIARGTQVVNNLQIKYIVSRSRMLNTILNSVVYSMQMQEMRSAVKENLLSVFNRVSALLRRQQIRENSTELQLQTISKP